MRYAAAVLLALLPTGAGAQALRCAVPSTPLPVHADLPSDDQPRRVLPIGGYTLAITWTPEYCHGHAQSPGSAFECGGANSFGWSLHGLWPDGVAATWPQYCRATALLPQATLRRNLCRTPSAQLLQHEWSKHGTCTGLSPDAYFGKSTGLYDRLRFPDMAALAERGTSAGALATAFARANPGIRPEAIRVTASKSGWLDEIWFCLDRGLAYARCRPGSGGVDPATMLRIARPRDGSRTVSFGSRPRRGDGDRYTGG
jgi:ribonuclease T2